MSIDFRSDIGFIYNEKPLIGYFSPSGILIDYPKVLDVACHEGDETLRTAEIFLTWISFIIDNTDYRNFGNCSSEKRELLKYSKYIEVVKRGHEYCNLYNSSNIEDFKLELNSEIETTEKNLRKVKVKSGKSYALQKFEYDLLLFFKDAYENFNFFDAINREIRVKNPEEMSKIFGKCISPYVTFDYEYDFYIKEKILKDHFKDICVQYLGYDSIERFSPGGNELKINNNNLLNYHCLSKFERTPRVISTSSANPYERFFNYLIMNWEIQNLPRYIFDNQSKLFVIDDTLKYHYNDKEEIYKKEIKSIKRLVRLEDRYKYFL